MKRRLLSQVVAVYSARNGLERTGGRLLLQVQPGPVDSLSVAELEEKKAL